MTHLLGEKSLDVLVFISLNGTGEYATFAERWDALCAKWGAKVVDRKLEELYDRGYIECGVTTRTGWLTEKGMAKLREYAGTQR